MIPQTIIRQRLSTAQRSSTEQRVRIKLPRPHPKQAEFVDSNAKFIVVKAGRRGGKTAGFAIRAVKRFLKGRRQIYAAPTARQVKRFWIIVCRALRPLIDAGVLHKNETERLIEFPGTDISIQAQTAWNPNTLRGDWCHDLYLDEFQLMNEATWDSAGAPLLADKNGDACFGFTPPSLRNEGVTKADDPQHAAKFYERAKADKTGLFAVFKFSSYENPHVSKEALTMLARNMTALSYRIEILVEDVNQAPGALWNRDLCEDARVLAKSEREFDRIVVSVDPSTTSAGDEAGVIGVGRYKWGGYVLEDASVQGSPTTWATAAVNLYYKLNADCIVAEGNQGGEMITTIINGIDPDIKVKIVYASHGKAARAEPVAAFFEVDEIKPVRRGFLCGSFPDLEDELCTWEPIKGKESPNRLDAMVWGFTELLIADSGPRRGGVQQVGW